MKDTGGNGRKEVLWGAVWVLGALWFYSTFARNPLHEIALIRGGQVTEGLLVAAWEEVGDSDAGQAVWSHGGGYTFDLPGGRRYSREFSGSGRLRAEFRYLEEPQPIEVEYLPGNPEVSRLRGNGSGTIFDLLWRQVGLGAVLLVMFAYPGFAMIRGGLKEMTNEKRPPSTDR